MTTIRQLTLTLVSLAFLAVPSTALAGTADIEQWNPTGNGAVEAMTFRADPGETNNIRVYENLPYRVIYIADSNPVTAGAGCVHATDQNDQPNPNEVACKSPSGNYLVRILTGDMNDTLTGAGSLYPQTAFGQQYQLWFYGGPGTDTLDPGDAAAATLDGGPGADTLKAGSFNTPTHGEVPITADYSAHTSPVSLSNDGVANDGAPGEGDNIDPAINYLVGGAAADTLTGHGQLDGGAGNDTLTAGSTCDGDGRSADLIGGDGNDTLNGGPCYDQFAGGAGQDRINSRDGVAETVGCGDGYDTVTADFHGETPTDPRTADSGDTVQECERINGLDPNAFFCTNRGAQCDQGTGLSGDGSGSTSHPRPKLHLRVVSAKRLRLRQLVQHRGLTVKVGCDHTCSRQVSVWSARPRVSANTAIGVRSGKLRTLTVHLSKPDLAHLRAALRHRTSVSLQVTVAAQGNQADASVRRTVRITQ
jgi:hypothetical protein